MDLNLALKFDKMGKHGEKRQPKKRSQSQFTTRGDRDNAGATGEKGIKRQKEPSQGCRRWIGGTCTK